MELQPSLFIEAFQAFYPLLTRGELSMSGSNWVSKNNVTNA